MSTSRCNHCHYLANGFSYLVLVFVSCLLQLSYSSESNIQIEMEKIGIVPDVIGKAPAEKLKVTYGDVEVDCGNTLTPTQVKDEPKVEWNAEPDAYYTLCMTDPDFPNRSDPKLKEFQNWLVVNIPGNDVSKGEVLSEMISSGPPKDAGLLRYVFLVYKQNGKMTFNEPRLKNNSVKNRVEFSIAKFAEKYNLGDPISGNFYQAEWDDYVPKLMEKLNV